MSAIDWIKGGRAKGVKKEKHDETWKIEGTTLFFDGQPLSGSIDWERSRYLRTGHHTDFYCMMSGSNVMYVMPEIKREGYAEPPKLKWGMPIPEHSEDDEDES